MLDPWNLSDISVSSANTLPNPWRFPWAKAYSTIYFFWVSAPVSPGSRNPSGHYTGQ
jgi:hypothetical protein